CPFTWTWLGAAAVRTNKIQVGTGVTCPIVRYHPAIIAQAAATVSCFAPGRTYLGVGTGEALNEYPVTREWPEYNERLERLEEAIDAAIQEQIKYWAGTYVPAMFAQKIYTPTMSQENGEVVGPETIKKTGCFSPSSDDHIQFIQQYIELGFNTIILHSPGPDQQAF